MHAGVEGGAPDEADVYATEIFSRFVVPSSGRWPFDYAIELFTKNAPQRFIDLLKLAGVKMKNSESS